MSLSFLHMLFIFITCSVFLASSNPITTNPDDHVVTLTSSGGEQFNVKLHVALQSETIKQVIMDGGFNDENIILSFPNITSEIMVKVLEYCNKHEYYAGPGNNITADDEMKMFDAQFVNVHYGTLFKLYLAANDLKIRSLSDLIAETIGNMMLGKTPNKIRQMFNIKDSCIDHYEQEESDLENARTRE
ncbi:S-phase kinase-associated protein 1-like, SKP1/BTB/POZ domain protein [Artemisia annua]|uniref:SKP1-like protein n=1 Tax=Artemisia annua TaxID=35608 RepID=A0A2U1N703_ARTAN|nr:S-phase kinase-associated protein 1-like, SKP1/BTB/POZ domain protein [Artemisia annua]